MRYVYLVLTLLVVVASAALKLPAFEFITATFLSSRITLPISSLAMLMYFLGMLAGGFLILFVQSVMPRSSSAKQ